jgi:hypothetical protein
MKTRKFIIVSVCVILICIAIPLIGNQFKTQSFLSCLDGTIIFTQRDNDKNLVLYESDATLKNRKLVTGHPFGDEQNLNIVDFDYKDGELSFVAMKDNIWTRFIIQNDSVIENGKEETLVTDEIRKVESNGIKVIKNDDKSIYMITNEETVKILEAKDDNSWIDTFEILAISPNGKYLIYNDYNFAKKFGFLYELFSHICNTTFVMDLTTEEKVPYMDTNDIIWIN